MRFNILITLVFIATLSWLYSAMAVAGPRFVKKARAGKILKCASGAKMKSRHVCLISTWKGSRGSRIDIYNHNQNWVASGYIYKRRNNRAIILVNNIRISLRRGYMVKFGTSWLDESDWSSAFSQVGT